MDPAQTEQLFLGLLVPDTQAVAAAEEQIKQLLRVPSCVEACLALMSSSQNEAVRQLSAVLLAKRINTHWGRLPPQAQQAIPGTLLRLLNEDPDRLARRSLARLIAVLAKNLLAAEQWNDLLPTLAQMVQQGSPAQRESAFLCFHNLSELVATRLEAHFATMRQIYLAGMADAEPLVRLAAMRAAVMLVVYLAGSDDVQQFGDLVPAIIALCSEAAGDDELLTSTFEVVGQIAESRVRILGPHIAQLVQMLIAVAQNEQIVTGTRDSAVGCLMQLCRFKPRMVAKQNLVNPIMWMYMSLIAASDCTAAQLSDVERADADDEDRVIYQMAASGVDTLAQSIPKKYLFRPTVELCLGALQHEDPRARKAAITVMGLIGEGCAEPLTDNMAELLPAVLTAANDPAPEVRENALFAIGQWSEHCPSILRFHAELLPVVFTRLDEPGNVKMTAAYVLEAFAEQLDRETILIYLEQFMTKLVSMLNADRKVVDIVIAAISAFAIGAEDAFAPFVDPVLAILQPLLQLTAEEDWHLRGRAMESFGYMARAVGADAVRPHLQTAMMYAMQGLNFDDYELCDFTYGFITNMCQTFEDEFAPYVEISEHLLQRIVETDENAFTEEVRNASSSAPQVAFSVAEGDDVDDDDEGGRGLAIMHVRTSMLDAKASAINALGHVALATGAAFGPYLERSFQALNNLSNYFHGNVRRAAAEAMKHFATVAVLCYHPEGPVDGQPLAEQANAVVKAVLDYYSEVFMGDTDATVVAASCVGVQHIVELCGEHAIAHCGGWVLERLSDLLLEQAVCQQDNDEVAEDEDEESEHDAVLDAVTDTLAAVARVLGPAFQMPMQTIFPMLIDYTREGRSEIDQYMAIGCIAELGEALEGLCEEYVPVVAPLLIGGLTHTSPHIQRNSAYCAGIFGLYGGASIREHTLPLLTALRPLLSTAGDVEANVCDNATSAVARLIMAPDSTVPLDQVVPVFVEALPLREDMMENAPVYKCLAGLLAGLQPALVTCLPRVLSVIGHVIATNDVADEIKVELCTAVQTAMANGGPAVQAALQQADPAALQSLQAAGVVG